MAGAAGAAAGAGAAGAPRVRAFSPRRAPAKRARAVVAQPHLEANMAKYRELVGVFHRYWNRAMPREAQWSVIIIAVLPPERGQLRIRLVVEARQTSHDGTGRGTVIGPYVRLTPPLVELEKRTKAANPPGYYRERQETTRKACDQLTVGGRRSVWLLKKYLQGQELLPDDILPPRAVHFVPSFDAEQIEAALASSRGRPAAALAPAAPPAPPRPTERSARACAGCGDGVFVAFAPGQDGARAGVGISTGVACSSCGLALCGTCTFAALAANVRCPGVRFQRDAVCALPGASARRCDHAADAPPPVVLRATWFAEAGRLPEGCAARAYVGDGGVLDHAALERNVGLAEERRIVFATWASCFTTTVVHECRCGAASLLPLAPLRRGADPACLECGAPSCAVCGGPVPCACGSRRAALDGAVAPPAPRFAVETAMHLAHSAVAGAAEIARVVADAFGGDAARAARCGASLAAACEASALVAGDEHVRGVCAEVCAALAAK